MLAKHAYEAEDLSSRPAGLFVICTIKCGCYRVIKGQYGFRIKLWISTIVLVHLRSDFLANFQALHRRLLKMCLFKVASETACLCPQQTPIIVWLIIHFLWEIASSSCKVVFGFTFALKDGLYIKVRLYLNSLLIYTYSNIGDIWLLLSFILLNRSFRANRLCLFI